MYEDKNPPPIVATGPYGQPLANAASDGEVDADQTLEATEPGEELAADVVPPSEADDSS